MRVHQRHERCETVVRNAENPHLAVGFGDVLDEPIDGVVGVGRMIDVARVQRSAQGPGHDIAAFRPMLAADVLHHANIAAVDHGIVRDIGAVDQRGQVRTAVLGDALRRAVGGPRKQYRRAMRASRNQNEGFQLDAVAHGNHDFALRVVEGVDARDELRRRLARQRVGGDRRQVRHQQTAGRRQQPTQAAAPGACAPIDRRHRYTPVGSFNRALILHFTSFTRP